MISRKKKKLTIIFDCCCNCPYYVFIEYEDDDLLEYIDQNGFCSKLNGLPIPLREAIEGISSNCSLDTSITTCYIGE